MVSLDMEGKKGLLMGPHLKVQGNISHTHTHKWLDPKFLTATGNCMIPKIAASGLFNSSTIRIDCLDVFNCVQTTLGHTLEI